MMAVPVAALPECAVPMMHAPVPAEIVRPVAMMVAMVRMVSAVMMDTAEVVEAKTQIERDRRAGVGWVVVGVRVGIVGGRRRAVHGATAKGSCKQERKYKAFRRAFRQDVHDSTPSNMLPFYVPPRGFQCLKHA